jgi:hypothetical protein
MKDPCHFNMFGASDEELYGFFATPDLSKFKICTPEGIRGLTLADLKRDHTEDNA